MTLPFRHASRRISELWRKFLLVLCIQVPLALVLIGLYSQVHEDGVVDADGLNVGKDYPVYYLAASMAWRGEAVSAYDREVLTSRSEEVLGFVSDDLPWLYPPTFFFILAPFAVLPLAWSLLAWTALNAGAVAAWAIGFSKKGWFALAALAFPASLLSLFAGQNGGVTAGLLGGGMLLLDRRPVIAGVLIGFAGFKPQLGLLLPFALLGGRCWLTFVAASATYILVAAGSALIFGLDSWWGHVAAMTQAKGMVEDSSMPISKMVTVLSMLRQFGVSHDIAMGVQYVLILAAIAFVALVWRRHENPALRISVLVIAMFLAAPYAYFYDLTILALPLLLWARDAYEKGWRPGEPLLLALFWMAPYMMWALAVFGDWHFWPVLLLALLAVLWNRFSVRAGEI
jgi:hypothetical protein